MNSIAFFNNKGGVGKTTLVYHLSHMLATLGHRVLAVDLDPQSNLSSIFLSEERLAGFYESETARPTIMQGIRPLNKGIGDIGTVPIESIAENLGLIIGDLNLSLFEDKLSANWGKCLDRDEAAFRVISSFYRILKRTAASFGAEYVLIDVGPNFGAINRAALIAAAYVVVPMGADLFSLQGLRNLGNRLMRWRREWNDRLQRVPEVEPGESRLELPNARMHPLGYIVMQHGIKQSYPVKSYLRWANRIPEAYDRSVLNLTETEPRLITDDEHCLALLKHYHSLAPMAMEARKPIFQLKPADGAIGAHYGATRQVFRDFEELAGEIIKGIADAPQNEC